MFCVFYLFLYKMIKMEIGDKIRELRISKGFTQENLAMLAGFSKSYIQKFEENKREVNTSQLVILANALNVSISEILSSSNFNTKDFKFSNIEFRDKHNLYNIDEFKKSITSDLYAKFYAYEILENILDEKVKFKNPIANEPSISDTKSVEQLAKMLRKKMEIWKYSNL